MDERDKESRTVRQKDDKFNMVSIAFYACEVTAILLARQTYVALNPQWYTAAKFSTALLGVGVFIAMIRILDGFRLTQATMTHLWLMSGICRVLICYLVAQFAVDWLCELLRRWSLDPVESALVCFVVIVEAIAICVPLVLTCEGGPESAEKEKKNKKLQFSE